MGLFSRNSETDALRELVDELPDRVADWTPEQRQEFNAQSDAAAFEQVSKSGG